MICHLSAESAVLGHCVREQSRLTRRNRFDKIQVYPYIYIHIHTCTSIFKHIQVFKGNERISDRIYVCIFVCISYSISDRISCRIIHTHLVRGLSMLRFAERPKEALVVLASSSCRTHEICRERTQRSNETRKQHTGAGEGPPLVIETRRHLTTYRDTAGWGRWAQRSRC